MEIALRCDSSTTNKWLNQKGEWSTPTAAQVGAATTGHNHDGTYVPMSGTLGITGSVGIKASTINLSSANNGANSSRYLAFVDTNEVGFGRIVAGTEYSEANGYETYIRMQTRGKDSSGNNQSYYGIGVHMNKAGTVRYDVSYKAAFREAISAAEASHNHDGTYAILSGTNTFVGGIILKHATVDVKSATNGVSDNTNRGINFYDKNGTNYAVFRSAAQPDGDVAVYMGVQNRNTSNEAQGWKGFQITANKSGGVTYSLSDKAAFWNEIRSAAIGTTSTTAAAGNHNHDSAYLSATGGTLTGSLIINNSTDLSGTAANDVALCLGTQTSQHIEIDTNEIQSKSNGTTVSTLYLNYDGGQVTMGKNDTSSQVTIRYTTSCTSSGSGGALRVSGGIRSGENIYGVKVYNAVWNDYAEYRKADTLEPGYCVTETISGTMTKSTARLQPGCKIISDTFGTCMGRTSEAQTPIAVAGRVLVYPYRNRYEYELGAAVCSAPDGKVDIMTREEVMMYPERIVGTVSEIPNYEEWNGGALESPEKIKVNGRIWIYIK